MKTAIAGGDPNWGRIVSAAGYAGVPFDPAGVRLRVNGFLLYEQGGEGGGAGGWIVALLLVAALGAGGFFGWRWWSGERADPTMEHASMLAWSAVQSWRQGDADCSLDRI